MFYYKLSVLQSKPSLWFFLLQKKICSIDSNWAFSHMAIKRFKKRSRKRTKKRYDQKLNEQWTVNKDK